jgi:deoxyribose-phosphate aldolase
VVTLPSLIDQTLLKPEAQRSDIQRLCDEALEYHFGAVCLAGSWVGECVQRLSGSSVAVVTVAGFPLGASTTRSKVAETDELIGLGADEIDMVAPIGRMLDGDWEYVAADIAAVVEAADGRIVKVILETAVLDRDTMRAAARVAEEAGAGFVKTSTGMHPAGGATLEAVRLLRQSVGPDVGVKAAGGIRTRETALQMLAAGATRIGTSSGVAIVGAGAGSG